MAIICVVLAVLVLIVMGASAEWNRIYDVCYYSCRNTICGNGIDRIGYRNSEIGWEKEWVVFIIKSTWPHLYENQVGLF